MRATDVKRFHGEPGCHEGPGVNTYKIRFHLRSTFIFFYIFFYVALLINGIVVWVEKGINPSIPYKKT